MSNFQIPPLATNPNTLTAAGISSGAYFSNMMLLTDPLTWKGAGTLIGAAPIQDANMKLTIGEGPQEALDEEQYMQGLRDKERMGQIGPLSAIQGMPYYQLNGELDFHVTPQWVNTIRNIFKRLGANIEYELLPNYCHMLPPDTGRYVSKHLYENMPGSGFDNWNQWNETPDENWEQDGFMGKFDQNQYVADGKNAKDIHLRDWGFFYYPKSCIQGGCNVQVFFHGCLQEAESLIDMNAAWAAQNNQVLIMPQAEDCWEVHGGHMSKPHPDDPFYFTNQSEQFKFARNIVNAVMAPIDSTYNYTERQNFERYSTYDPSLFMWNGMKLHCEEFLNQNCEMSGDCFAPDPSTGEMRGTLEEFGIHKAEEGQCDDRSMWQRMRDGFDEMFMMDDEGNVTIMESATTVAASAITALSVAMTLY